VLIAMLEALSTLADSWERDAETISRYRSDAGDAQVLKTCSRDLRRIAGDHTPEWVPLRTVQARTGRSSSYLYKLCQQLETSGQARRTPRGSWELSLQAAREIPSRRGHTAVETRDLQELARMLAREV
jgi:DNA-binding IclR family transcriptional regulator